MTARRRRDPEDFGRHVEARARRRRRAQQGRDSVWFGLGAFGLVGWSVAIPTLAGIAVGAWFDGRATERTISWTLTGLSVGVAMGCALAWYWIRQESARSTDTPDEGHRPDGPAAPRGPR